MDTELAILPPPKPVPRVSVNVRPAVADDYPFIDGLMKMHSHMVGFAPRKQLEKNIEDGQVLIAEELPVGSPALRAGSAPPLVPCSENRGYPSYRLRHRQIRIHEAR
jgi:hypothetical protein